jgi:hypothetical protein
MAFADPALEKRAQEIFEREGDKTRIWNLVATQRTPSADTIAAIGEEAKQRYRDLASKELAAEGRS